MFPKKSNLQTGVAGNIPLVQDREAEIETAGSKHSNQIKFGFIKAASEPTVWTNHRTENCVCFPGLNNLLSTKLNAAQQPCMAAL